MAWSQTYLKCLLVEENIIFLLCVTKVRRLKLQDVDNERSHRWFVGRSILYKGTLARNPRCSRRRRIDEANTSTPVAVDQCAANSLDEAVRPFIECEKTQAAR
ncbi:hypothetical protein TNCV_2814071 [Trichonephila clavipes]|nr:hypothetical protein TNCV_2814071 [Trichonephila clavipes]